jgi:hypothetical protein
MYFHKKINQNVKKGLKAFLLLPLASNRPGPFQQLWKNHQRIIPVQFHHYWCKDLGN